MRPRVQQRRGGGRKHVLLSTWHPRAPNIKTGFKMFEEILYMSKDNDTVFPRGSIMPGFRRGRNLGELIAPTQPQREERGEGGGKELEVFLQVLYTPPVRGPAGGDQHQEQVGRPAGAPAQEADRLHILCPCGGAGGGAGVAGGGGGGAGVGQSREYVGSAYSIKRRWSKHKSDNIRKHIWTACGLARHFERFQQGDMEVAISNLQVTLLHHLEGPFTEEGLRDL